MVAGAGGEGDGGAVSQVPRGNGWGVCAADAGDGAGVCGGRALPNLWLGNGVGSWAGGGGRGGTCAARGGAEAGQGGGGGGGGGGSKQLGGRGFLRGEKGCARRFCTGPACGRWIICPRVLRVCYMMLQDGRLGCWCMTLRRGHGGG